MDKIILLLDQLKHLAFQKSKFKGASVEESMDSKEELTGIGGYPSDRVCTPGNQ